MGMILLSAVIALKCIMHVFSCFCHFSAVHPEMPQLIDKNLSTSVPSIFRGKFFFEVTVLKATTPCPSLKPKPKKKWTDLQSTVIWLGILMSMLDLAGCSQDIWQIIIKERSVTAQRDEQGRISIQETDTDSWKLQYMSSSKRARIPDKPGSSSSSSSSTYQGPPFQDLLGL